MVSCLSRANGAEQGLNSHGCLLLRAWRSSCFSSLSYDGFCFPELSHKMQETGSMRNTNVTLSDLKLGSPRSRRASLWSVPGWLLSVSSHRLSFLKAFVCLRFYYFRFLYLCVGACIGAQMSGEAGRDCQLSLGLQAIVGHLAWMLGTLLKSSARALFALNQLSHLSSPCLSFLLSLS